MMGVAMLRMERAGSEEIVVDLAALTCQWQRVEQVSAWVNVSWSVWLEL